MHWSHTSLSGETDGIWLT